MFERLHPVFQRIALRGPYLVALLFFALLVYIVTHPSGWMSGLTGNYLSVHIVLEFVGILVSFAIFTVGWATYHNAQDSDILVLSIASFAVGVLDLGHTLSFTGMPDFFGASGPNKAIYFWLASRAAGSLAFLYVAVSPPRLTRIKSLQWVLLAVAVFWVWVAGRTILVHPERLPVFFVQGQGLSPSKIAVEWVLVIVSCVAGALLFIDAEKRANMNMRWMACASLLYGMCGYFFTMYRDFDDMYNFSGHCFKAVSYVLLYRAVFLECVSRPYERVQQLAMQAEASSLSKSRFLANVSHEFRTPLGVIAGFGDLLTQSKSLQEPLQSWAQTIVRNAKQLSLLIDDLLDLAKAETEKIEIRLSRFDLNNLISQMSQSLSMHVRGQIEIVLENELKDSSWIVTDELRTRQVLTNIIGNAIKFTQNGKITIRYERCEKDLIKILVKDTGIGIDPGEAGRLFQPFSQVSNPNNRRFGGTGLGLSLSRQLAELLGGHLILKWSETNVGSQFEITLRDQTAENKNIEMADAKSLVAAPLFRGRHILIAEDSEDNQFLLNSYLSPTEVQITFAGNGKLALDLVTSSLAGATGTGRSDSVVTENVRGGPVFDLILMDIQMPEMDGFEATAELRRRHWTGKIIALTAHALQPERERAMKNGFDDYLVKPIKKEDLWAAIAQAFRRNA